MKAFLVGLLFLILLLVFVGIGVLLFPVFMILYWLLRLVLAFMLVILAIWFLGKVIILFWEKIR